MFAYLLGTKVHKEFVVAGLGNGMLVAATGSGSAELKQCSEEMVLWFVCLRTTMVLW